MRAIVGTTLRFGHAAAVTNHAGQWCINNSLWLCTTLTRHANVMNQASSGALATHSWHAAAVYALIQQCYRRLTCMCTALACTCMRAHIDTLTHARRPPCGCHISQCPVYRYDEEEWNTLIADPASNWSRSETDYLLSMVEQFDQRFIVIADRWEVGDRLGSATWVETSVSRLLSACKASIACWLLRAHCASPKGCINAQGLRGRMLCVLDSIFPAALLINCMIAARQDSWSLFGHRPPTTLCMHPFDVSTGPCTHACYAFPLFTLSCPLPSPHWPDLFQFPGGPPRNLEDLKERYYSIARKLLVRRRGLGLTQCSTVWLRWFQHPGNALSSWCMRSAWTLDYVTHHA